MPGDKKEPQSYGSQADWQSGETGQQVNRPKAAPAAPESDFYESRHDGETSGPGEGGSVSPVQAADTAGARVNSDRSGDVQSQNVTNAHGGARRDGFFKKRDY